MTEGRRRHTRLAHSIPARVEHVDSSGFVREFDGQLSNVSISGLAVTFSHSSLQPIGDFLPVHLGLIRTQDTLALSGRVTHLTPRPDGSCMVGIQFDQVCPNLVVNLSSHLRVVVRVGESTRVLNDDAMPFPSQMIDSDRLPVAPDLRRLAVTGARTAVCVAILYGACQALLLMQVR